MQCCLNLEHCAVILGVVHILKAWVGMGSDVSRKDRIRLSLNCIEVDKVWPGVGVCDVCRNMSMTSKDNNKICHPKKRFQRPMKGTVFGEKNAVFCTNYQKLFFKKYVYGPCVRSVHLLYKRILSFFCQIFFLSSNFPIYHRHSVFISI